MENANHSIVETALNARTLEQSQEVQRMIEVAIGTRHERPLGDTWNNQGILTASGSSYDHKVLEVVTNMQDAVLELKALQEHGERRAAPYSSPHDAAKALLGTLDKKAQAELATVTIDSSTRGKSRRIVSVTMRDKGCGIRPADVARGIFRVGAKHKDGIDWQQGTFGLGGATTYRNAKAVVLVTRRHPDLLSSDEEDHIAVAVVEWARQRTTVNASYLVTSPWDEDDPVGWAAAAPFSVPASDFPSFEPGTQLTLVHYETQGLGKRSGDETSFDTVLNTRLFRPVIPIRYKNNITRSERFETLDGLERRLADNPGDPGTEGDATLPFSYEGRTYHLPIRYRIFAKPRTPGERRKRVAKHHAVLITSNGQVHFHWSPQDFKYKTTLNKLYDRILIVVDSDALPIEVRTELFTADRSQLVATAPALRLEEEIVAFVNEWADLREANNALIREAITGDNDDRPTIEIAQKIARAMKVKGFAGTGPGTKGRGKRPPSPVPDEDLLPDPTHFEGPDEAEAVVGKVKGLYFKLNTVDSFLGAGGRGELTAWCDHPDIGPDEVVVGKLSKGRVRISVAVPEGADLGRCRLNVEIPPWQRSAGGLGPKFEWTTKLDIVAEATSKNTGTGAGGGKGKKGAGGGNLVALIWKSEEQEGVDDWTPATVGHIEMVQGADLAAQRQEYEMLKDVTDEIPTIVLNQTYSYLKSYIHARAAELTDEGKERAKERYAVGVGVSLLLLDADQRKRKDAGERESDPSVVEASKRAAARAVLSVLPDFDKLAKEIED